MEEIEKRVTHLERDLTQSMNQVARGIASLAQSLSEQEGTLYDMRAIQTQHGRDIRDLRAEVKLLQGNLTAFREEFRTFKAEQAGNFDQLIALLNERLPPK